MRTVLKYVEKIEKHTILCSGTFFRKLCCLWDNVKKYGSTRQATDENIIWCMCIVCWITKAMDAHSEYVIIIARPWHILLCDCTSKLRYTYVACLVCHTLGGEYLHTDCTLRLIVDPNSRYCVLHFVHVLYLFELHYSCETIPTLTVWLRVIKT